MTNHVSGKYFREHPDEIDDYLQGCFRDFSEDSCISALISSLRMITRVKGISTFQKEDDPKLENINAMVQAIDYHLAFETIE
jgi:DNA-binding phage protein